MPRGRETYQALIRSLTTTNMTPDEIHTLGVAEVKRLEILLNKTREEVAKEYVTKVDVHNDINRVLDRIDRLENKLDAFLKEQRSALG